MAGSGRVPPRGAARRSLLPSLQEQIWNKQSPRCKTNSCVGGRGSVLHTISIKYSVFGKHEGWQTQHGEGGTGTHTHMETPLLRSPCTSVALVPLFAAPKCHEQGPAGLGAPGVPAPGVGAPGFGWASWAEERAREEKPSPKPTMFFL